jgi:hypothetical protein
MKTHLQAVAGGEVDFYALDDALASDFLRKWAHADTADSLNWVVAGAAAREPLYGWELQDLRDNLRSDPLMPRAASATVASWLRGSAVAPNTPRTQNTTELDVIAHAVQMENRLETLLSRDGNSIDFTGQVNADPIRTEFARHVSATARAWALGENSSDRDEFDASWADLRSRAPRLYRYLIEGSQTHMERELMKRSTRLKILDEKAGLVINAQSWRNRLNNETTQVRRPLDPDRSLLLRQASLNLAFDLVDEAVPYWALRTYGEMTQKATAAANASAEERFDALAEMTDALDNVFKLFGKSEQQRERLLRFLRSRFSSVSFSQQRPVQWRARIEEIHDRSRLALVPHLGLTPTYEQVLALHRQLRRGEQISIDDVQELLDDYLQMTTLPVRAFSVLADVVGLDRPGLAASVAARRGSAATIMAELRRIHIDLKYISDADHAQEQLNRFGQLADSFRASWGTGRVTSWALIVPAMGGTFSINPKSWVSVTGVELVALHPTQHPTDTHLLTEIPVDLTAPGMRLLKELRAPDSPWRAVPHETGTLLYVLERDHPDGRCALRIITVPVMAVLSLDSVAASGHMRDEVEAQVRWFVSHLQVELDKEINGIYRFSDGAQVGVWFAPVVPELVQEYGLIAGRDFLELAVHRGPGEHRPAGSVPLEGSGIDAVMEVLREIGVSLSTPVSAAEPFRLGRAQVDELEALVRSITNVDAPAATQRSA